MSILQATSRPAPDAVPGSNRTFSLRPVDGLAIAVVGYVALYLAWSVFRWGGPDLELAINDGAFIPLGLMAIAFALYARARAVSAGTRRAWLLLTLAFAGYCFGDLAWFYVEVLRGEEVPWPSIADIGYLAFYPLALLGLLSLTRERTPSRLRAWLDLAIVLIGAGTVIWIVVIAPVAAANASDPVALAVAIAYPIGDALVLFALSAALLRHLTDTSRAALALLGVGLALNILADLVYARLALEEAYESGTWIDAAYMVGWGAMALAGYVQGRTQARAAVAGRPFESARPISLLPYGAVCLVFGFLVWETAETAPDMRSVVLGAVTVTGLVLIRQVVMAGENARLLGQQATLRSEARFRALIQNASDVMAVIDRAGVVTYVTPSCLRVLERDPAALVGTHLQEILGVDDEPIATSFIVSAASREGTTGPVEWRWPTAGSAIRFVDVTATNLLDDPFVEGIVVTIRDVTDRKLFEQQLQHQAFHDPLTGLANRALLANRVEHALSRARRRPAKPAVIYLDLDDFKRVNDSQGHDVGDQVLLEVAQRLRRTLREGDTAARLGGDEFAVLVEETSSVDEAEAVAKRIRDALVVPIDLDGGAITVTGSMGIVRADERGVNMVELLRNADIAMYDAKNATRGSYRVFEPTMYSQTVERVRLEDDLRGALANGELALAFQPLVDLDDSRVVGVEALLRWNHPRRGTVMPLQFIPIAERAGTIIPIGLWVVEEACRVVGGWNADLDVPLRANVNVSVRQLEPSFPDDVAAILARIGFPPELLVLELTESILAENRPEIGRVLADLRGIGVRISIDDFGTGYSSLSYLNDLPVDEIKIDRSFIRALAQDGDASVVATIIQLAHRMGVPTVAEGIELETQASALKALGCELGQGFLIGRPAFPKDLAARLVQPPEPSSDPARPGPERRSA